MKNIALVMLMGLYTYMSTAQQISPYGIYAAANTGIAGNLRINWVIGGFLASPGSSPAPLPVKLIGFAGRTINDGTAELEWKTVQETANAGFEIQKSTNGKAYTKIGWVDGGGSQSEAKTYVFVDYEFKTTSYYRLKQMDTNGQSILSRVVSVIPDSQNRDNFAAYPNPSDDGLIVVILPDRTTSLSLLNASGKIIFTELNPFSGKTVKLPLKGLYLLRIHTAVGEKTIKLISN